MLGRLKRWKVNIQTDSNHRGAVSVCCYLLIKSACKKPLENMTSRVSLRIFVDKIIVTIFDELIKHDPLILRTNQSWFYWNRCRIGTSKHMAGAICAKLNRNYQGAMSKRCSITAVDRTISYRICQILQLTPLALSCCFVKPSLLLSIWLISSDSHQMSKNTKIPQTTSKHNKFYWKLIWCKSFFVRILAAKSERKAEKKKKFME